MCIKRISSILMVSFLGMCLFAQEATFINPQGIEFILIKPGKMVVGKFQPTVNRGAATGGTQANAARPANATTPANVATPANVNQPVNAAAPAAVRPPAARLPESDYVLAEKMAKEASRPGFEVKIDKPFYIGKFEITQAQWEKVMGSNPSYYQGDKVTDNSDNHPVESVSWNDVQAFIKKLNALDKSHVYRLPIEFEWEYASRAGAEDDIPWADIRAMAVIGSKTTSEVGTKKPNAWGLFDTLGNVWEWVQDYYNEKIFADPVPLKKGTEHVLKGAPFYGDVKNATYMTHAGGPGSKYDVGFRLVMEIK